MGAAKDYSSLIGNFLWNFLCTWICFQLLNDLRNYALLFTIYNKKANQKGSASIRFDRSVS